MEHLLTFIFSFISKFICISVCKNFFGFDPQIEFDEFVQALGKTLSILLLMICVACIIALPVLAENWDEIQEYLTRDRKSPPRETWVNPDLDMNNSIYRILVNAKRE